MSGRHLGFRVYTLGMRKCALAVLVMTVSADKAVCNTYEAVNP